MNGFELPAVPLGIITLINVFAPYGIAILNHPAWKPTTKKIVAVIVSMVITGAAMLVYYLITKETLGNGAVLLVIGVLASQTSFTLITGKSANQLERKMGSPIV